MTFERFDREDRVTCMFDFGAEATTVVQPFERLVLV